MKSKPILSVILFFAVLMQTAYQSSGQISWNKYSGNPVMMPGSGYNAYGFPFVGIQKLDDTLHMWFTQSDGNPIGADRIGHGWSVDNIHFTQDLLVSLEPSTGSNFFDSEGVFGANVIFDGTVYRMFYNGYNTQPYYMGKMEVGLATSPDRITWTRISNDAVLKPGNSGSWDNGWAYQSTVLLENGIFKMWYTGFNGSNTRIGYATSADGINWIKHPSNPVIDPLQLGFVSAQNPNVLYTNGQYEMWFNVQASVSAPYQICYASSPDGVSWNVNPIPCLSVGSNGTFDDSWVWSPCVKFENGVYRMWYSGYDGTYWSVGYATDSTLAGILNPSFPGISVGNVLSVTPNPAKNTAHFFIHNELSGYCTLKLYSILGKEVELISGDYESLKLAAANVNVESLPTGVYICRLENKGLFYDTRLYVIR